MLRSSRSLDASNGICVHGRCQYHCQEGCAAGRWVGQPWVGTALSTRPQALEKRLDGGSGLLHLPTWPQRSLPLLDWVLDAVASESRRAKVPQGPLPSLGWHRGDRLPEEDAEDAVVALEVIHQLLVASWEWQEVCVANLTTGSQRLSAEPLGGAPIRCPGLENPRSLLQEAS